jgi:hypothetical protein
VIAAYRLTATRSIVAPPATNFSTAIVSLWERTVPKSGLLFPNLVSMATCLTEAIFCKMGIKPFRFILDALPCMLASPRARARPCRWFGAWMHRIVTSRIQ